MTNYAISTKNLSKTFYTGFLRRKQVALDALNLEVEQGEILGYLGPNGAGKTTTFKLLLGLIFPDKGTMTFFDGQHSDSEAKSRIGYLPENPYFYAYLTGRESLRFHGQLYGMENKHCEAQSQDLLKIVGLEHAAGKQLRKYSRGMLQRIGIAQALINDPDLLILDEPMSGLDPMGRKKIRDLILTCRDQGKTVIFSSHIISDVEILCDRAAILLDGKLQDMVSVSDILSREIQHWEISCTGLTEQIVDSFLSEKVSVVRSSKQILFKCVDENQARELISRIETNSGKIHSFNPHQENLEDIFVKKALA